MRSDTVSIHQFHFSCPERLIFLFVPFLFHFPFSVSFLCFLSLFPFLCFLFSVPLCIRPSSVCTNFPIPCTSPFPLPPSPHTFPQRLEPEDFGIRNCITTRIEICTGGILVCTYSRRIVPSSSRVVEFVLVVSCFPPRT
ncbi:hypothetical protein BYT27DRAFT_6876770 [Phlegmacium glaucopus]|nr:hypothetical protein BYT27DRAFT_6876770 [Phlegmacium glaucopus]